MTVAIAEPLPAPPDALQRRPRLLERYQALVVDGEGVVLLSDHREQLLPGRLHERLIPLLDGRHTVHDIATRLEAEHEPAEVFYALSRLEERGCLTDEATHAQAAGSATSPTMSPTSVTTTAGLDLVVTDSYLRAELADINTRALEREHPWLLARPAGTALWLGPLFRPGETCCWQCLEHRLRRNRPLEYHLLRRAGGTPAAFAPGATDAAHLAARTVLAREIADASRLEALAGCLVVLDLVTGERHEERVARRPQCPACGDPSLVKGRAARAFVPRSQLKKFTRDGGHRAMLPEETVAAFGDHVRPLTGVVQEVRQLGTGEVGPLQVCVARYGIEPDADGLPLADRVLRQASGKGMTSVQALASGLGEAIERYSCVFQGDESRRLASLEELGEAAIHPNLCMQFSETQYAERGPWNRRASRWQFVPRPLDPKERLEWTPVWSLTGARQRYLPTAFLYSGYPRAGADPCWVNDPNGNAAGNTHEEAVLQALMELIERDSLAIWWYNRLSRPALDPNALDDPWCRQLVRHYRALGRELWVLDITTDLGVPCFASVSRRKGPEDAILLGFGAHLDARVALTRALTELNQTLAHVDEATRAGRPLEATLARWLGEATLANQPYLVAGPEVTRLDAFPRVATDDLADDIRWCAQRLARHGLEAFVLDQTRPDVGVPVVKVVVPGLRHFRARYAPGRLYTVPVAMGALAGPHAESGLNPVPFFF